MTLSDNAAAGDNRGIESPSKLDAVNIARFEAEDAIRWGYLEADTVRPVSADVGLLDALADPKSLAGLTDSTEPAMFLAEVQLLAPIPAPPQFIGVGLNYREHAAEAGMDIPDAPVTFPFHRNAIIGPGAAIEIPSLSDQIDWEAELAVVIGSGGRDIPLDSALDHVAGYTIVNDVSARDVQWADKQWSRAKSFDTFKPMGPVITTTDELGDAGSLDISLTVNDKIMQASNTSDLIFPVAELVSYISRSTTLLPGAVIATGTPAGVGFSRKPPVFLKPGDTVSVEITGIGQLTNPVR